MHRTQAHAVTHQSQLSTYGRLMRRVNHLLSTPRAQVEKQANLSPSLADHPDDWDRLLDEISQADGVALTRRPDGSIHVRWLSTEH